MHPRPRNKIERGGETEREVGVGVFIRGIELALNYSMDPNSPPLTKH